VTRICGELTYNEKIFTMQICSEFAVNLQRICNDLATTLQIWSELAANLQRGVHA